MALANEWIGYIERSYQQAKDSIISKLPTKVPELTDHSESNLFIKMVSIFSGLLEQLNYYLDNIGRESYLSTCRKYESAVKIASQYDYRIHAVQAASTNVQFTIDAPAPSQITIPEGTLLSTEDGAVFETSAEAIIEIGETQVTTGAKQQELVAAFVIGQTTGVVNQRITLGKNIVQGSVSVSINGQNYANEESFVYTIGTDYAFIVSVDSDKNVYVDLGDGVNGFLPAAGLDITVSYYTSLGADANIIGPNEVINIDDVIALPGGVNSIEVTNVNRVSGGEGVESLVKLKKYLPLSLRMNDRCVTVDDFGDSAELVSGVANAKADHECGRVIDLYVVPNGGGVASQALLDDVEAYIEPRKVIGTQLSYKSAGVLEILLEIKARIDRSENNVAKAAEIKADLLDFMSTDNQEIKGTVYQSDIYEIIDAVPQVRNSNIIKMVAVPFATIKKGVNSLSWTRTVLLGSVAVVTWRIKYIGSNQFQLYKANQFVGTYAVGDLVTQTELSFTVSANSYATNDEWEFVTYPVSSDIEVNEFSVPVSFSTSITVTCTGGV
jgi:hypothetical protein